MIMANIGGIKTRKMPPWYIKELSLRPLVGGGLNHQLHMVVSTGLDAVEVDIQFDNNYHNFLEAVSAATIKLGVTFGTIKQDADGNIRATNKGFS
jgi:hypothetical protein